MRYGHWTRDVRMRSIMVLLACCATGMINPAAAGFLASPMEVHLNDSPGSRGTADILVTNTSDAPVTMKLYMGDSHPLPAGGEVETEPGDAPRSLVGWTHLQEQVLELGPGEAQNVTLHLNVPHDAEGSYWSKFFIEETSKPRSTTTEKNGREYQIFMQQRVAVRVFEDVAGTGKLGAVIRHVGAEDVTDGYATVKVTVENTGNLIARCFGHMELHNVQGEVVDEIAMGTNGEFWVFPDSQRELVVRTSKPLLLGTYTALAVIDFGGDHLVAGDAIIRIDTSSTDPQDRIAEEDR
jgi:hypothetical protein